MENIKDYYNITKEAQTPLLSNYSNADTDKDFWAFYRDNFEIFDRYFSREFDTFVFAFADKEQTTAENTADFVQAVKDLLTVNHKKYEELYRVEIVDDDSYSMLENYDLTETMERETTKGQQINTTSSTEGQQTDNTTLTYGDKTETSTSQISPEDDENWRNKDKIATTTTAQNDTQATTKGSRTDTGTQTEGAREDGEEYTLRRKGNIGVQTATQVMQLHDDFWKGHNFYKVIFYDIAAAYLLIGGDLCF